MAGFQEDVQSVLEQFVENVANLPAELAHLYEEMQAKDQKVAELRSNIQTKDASIQRWIKQNGSNVAYAKETNYTSIINRDYAQVSALQAEKCALAVKALDLINKHIKRLDAKIKDLQVDGLMPNEPIVTPAFLASMQVPAPLASSINRANGHNGTSTPAGHSRNSSANTTIALPTPSAPNATPTAATTTTTANTPIPGTAATPSAVVAHISNSLSAASNDAKRRRLTHNLSTSSATLPAAPSPLGAATPLMPSPARTVHTGRKPPRRGTLLSKKRAREEDEDEDAEDDNDDEEEEAGEDQRPYCTCRQVSFGDMVACDDTDCPYEWFHWSCVGLTREPVGKWFCDYCSAKRKGTVPKKEGSV